MEKLRRLEVAVRVADAGSFSRAARTLGVTPSAVSHAIAQLEQDLGVALFYRTTRQLRLTEEGEALCTRARSLLEQLLELESVVAKPSERLRGVLRVGLSVSLSRLIVMPALSLFTRQHPELRLEFVVLTRIKEMHIEGVDLMLRVGEIADSGLVARRIATIRFGVYAAAEYVERAGAPRLPEDLLQHRCLVYRDPNIGLLDAWTFARAGERKTVKLNRPAVISDDREGLHAAMVGGAGIARMGNFEPTLLTSGRLRRLLPDWEVLGGFPVHALYRRTPKLGAKIAAFLDFAIGAFGQFDPQELTLVHEKAGLDFRRGQSARP
jgi:DNA-binding transcriptional LysR family regulator